MKPIKVNKKPMGKFSVSPYNFISFPNKFVFKYKNIEEMPNRNNFKTEDGKELLRGYVDYVIKAETPIIVGGSSQGSRDTKFFRNLNGDYAIPGSTIRGLIRTNSEILSFSNVTKEIEDSRFLYRDIAGNNALSNQYRKTLGIKGQDSIARNLKTGYLKKEGNKYYIYPSIDMNMEKPYFRINEIKLRKMAGNNKDIQFMYKTMLLDKEEEIKKTNSVPTRNRILGSVENKGFKPYQIEISFNFDSKKRITDIGSPGEYSNRGYLLSSNHIWGKMAHYIVPAEDEELARIEISEDYIVNYLDDMLLTKKAEKSGGEVIVKAEYDFYALPNRDEVKPVFYIQFKDELHFGFTPFLRLRYGKSILDGVPSEYHKHQGVSYTESIFGFINKISDGNLQQKYNYKSRVSFEDANIIGNGVIDKDGSIDILLAEPKATSFNLYLKQDLNSDKKDLNIYEDDFTLRGFKQYWLKEYIEVDTEDKNKNMINRIYPLKEGTKFKGRIYFENLEEDELGLILWSLKLEDDCFQSIGLGKPFGFGRVKLEEIQLNIEDLEEKYNSFSFDFFKREGIEKFIDIYKREFSQNNLNGEDLEKTQPIREFMEIKSKLVKEEDANYYRYMGIKDFRDKKVLPEILEYEESIKTPEKSYDNINKGTRQNQYNIKEKHNNKDNKKQDTSKTDKSFGVGLDLSNWGKGK